MSRARGDSGLDGFLNVCKPVGPTSHDIVARIRRRLGTRRVGHAGTLDPLAAGVLPLALGRATRLIDYLASADKEYEAAIELGRRTASDDEAGEVISIHSVEGITVTAIDAALAQLTGSIEQLPPAFSALKIEGRRAYHLARRGLPVTLAARRVTIERIERLDWDSPILTVRVHCSKGTYIRALARDLGDSLGVGGSLRRLTRLRVGPFTVDRAASMEEVEAAGRTLVLPPDLVLGELPAITVDSEQQANLGHGRPWPAETAQAGLARAYGEDGAFVGLLECRDGLWQPKLVFLD